MRSSPTGGRGLTRGSARVRAYYTVEPDQDSRLTLDAGDEESLGRSDAGAPVSSPTPPDAGARGGHARTYADVVRGPGEGQRRQDGQPERPELSGPSRPAAAAWASDPATSVTDSYGRTHDHENLFVVGSPTLPTGGCTNGTLTFVALALRSAEQVARA